VRTTSVLSEWLEDVVPQLEGHARPVFLDRDDRALFDQRPVVLLRLRRRSSASLRSVMSNITPLNSA
jgi:hypothetical protein